MPRSPQKLLCDILDAAEFILDQTLGKSLTEYERDRLLSNAVERNFITIGEALGRLARLNPQAASALGDYPQVIGFQNIVVHGYDVLEHAIVWGIIQNELPQPTARAQLVLKQLDTDVGN